MLSAASWITSSRWTATWTERLRLEPIGPGHHDDAVAEWHGGQWTTAVVHSKATRCGQAWEADGVHKWMAYDRVTGGLVGRGGLSRR